MLMFFSCRESQHDKVVSMIEEWEQKEIQFPSSLIFTMQGKDTLEYSVRNKYKIITYVDSLGCTSCKLHLPEWKKFINIVDSLYPDSIQFLFFFSPKNRNEICRILLEDRFQYPICIDEHDSINILNKFPSNINFQTFFLNHDNKIMAIGNPIHNSKIKELYLKIIDGGKLKTVLDDRLQTNIIWEKTSFDFGVFDWTHEQVIDFTLYNIGKEKLVMNEVFTSCGCISVEYSKKPVEPGEKVVLRVKYKAEHPEYFNKTITIYCNAKGAPFQLKLSGSAN